MRSPLLTRVTVLALSLSCPLAAQETSVAPSYPSRFGELFAMAPMKNQVASIRNLVLRRDRGEITFEEGTLVLLTPVGGRYRGAVFAGKGTFRLAPSIPIEQERVKLFRKTTAVEEAFTDAVLLFTDSTLAQLQAGLVFSDGAIPSRAQERVREALDYVGDKDHQTFDPDLLRGFLNDESNGILYVHMGRENYDPWMFQYNPLELESVQLLARAKRTGFTRYAEVVTQFAEQRDTVRTGGRAERRAEMHVEQYTMELRLPQTGSGEIAFHAKARIEFAADTAIGPWIPFWLFDKMTVDSARWSNGDPAEVFKGKDAYIVWVRTDQRLRKGDRRAIDLYYRGDLLDRLGDWFFVKSSIAWYPLTMETRQQALFDITYLSPEGFQLASIGDRADSSSAPGHMIRTRWVTPAPIRNASFTMGRYEQYRVEADDVPPVTVLWSNDMHKLLDRRFGGGTSGKDMQKQVGDDVVNAMRFYQHVFGPAPIKHFYATEIPGGHGEAWPGIVGLSWVTFHNTSNQGYDEMFRAHEVAHQWFGIGVDYATYRDRWLSEGFSNFAGLWYMQNRRANNDRYFGVLDEWRTTIMRRRNEPIPIWLGHRVATATTGDDYSTIVYQKGAWTLHMLRMLLLDLRTMNEDRFTAVMREYYTRFAGKAASTDDFQQVIERQTGQQLGWFFNQWVRGSAIPTYRVANRVDEADGKFQVRLRVTQEQVPEDFLMYVPVAVEFDNKQVMRFRVKVTGARSEIPLPPLPARPKSIRFNDMSGVLAEVKNEGW